MVKFFMLVGIAGSGKSTLAERLARGNDALIVSSDAIRGELYGDETEQGDPREVFRLMEERTLEGLRSGTNVVYDATNVTEWRRSKMLQKIGDGVWKECVWVDTPLEQALRNNQQRSRNVPEWVIRMHARQFEVPTLDEGWDRVVRFCLFRG